MRSDPSLDPAILISLGSIVGTLGYTKRSLSTRCQRLTSRESSCPVEFEVGRDDHVPWVSYNS